jgi:hypothetical protein
MRVIPYPNEAYLVRLGKLAYAVGYLEWAMLGDLPHINGLPATLDISKLVGRTTTKIGEALCGSGTLDAVEDRNVREWLRTGGEALKEAAPDRNQVLHARPATFGDGQQRLYRWEPRRHEAFWITDDVLDEIIDRMYERLRAIDRLRPGGALGRPGGA